MLDHVSLKVGDYARAQAFYDAALRPLGVSRQIGDGAHYAGYGVPNRPFFWIGEGAGGGSAHVAFSADDQAAVTAFYEAALAAGGKDNGGPGLRPEYDPGYYAAFVFDPDGNNIEAVCHTGGR